MYQGIYFWVYFWSKKQNVHLAQYSQSSKIVLERKSNMKALLFRTIWLCLSLDINMCTRLYATLYFLQYFNLYCKWISFLKESLYNVSKLASYVFLKCFYHWDVSRNNKCSNNYVSCVRGHGCLRHAMLSQPGKHI